MKIHKALLIAVAVILVGGAASADIKIVKMDHTDGFNAMGRTTPPLDQEQVTWIGKDSMRTDSGDASTIIRLDTKKLYVLNHDEKTYNTLDLPVDLAQFMPPGMAEQMMSDDDLRCHGHTDRRNQNDRRVEGAPVRRLDDFEDGDHLHDHVGHQGCRSSTRKRITPCTNTSTA